MDVSELITIIREDYLDDTFEGWENATQAERDDQFIWSDKALLRYLTEAQRQACNRTDFLYDELSITLKAGRRDYPISQNITRIEQVIYNDKPVVHISREERDRNLRSWRTDEGMTGKTCHYMIRGRKIFFYPLPDTLDDGNKVYLNVWHLPIDPVASVKDELVIPEEYHRDLIWWVLYEAYSKQDADGYDKEKGTSYLARFEQIFGGYVSSEVRLNQLQEPENLGTRPVNYLNDADRDEWYG